MAIIDSGPIVMAGHGSDQPNPGANIVLDEPQSSPTPDHWIPDSAEERRHHEQHEIEFIRERRAQLAAQRAQANKTKKPQPIAKFTPGAGASRPKKK